MSRDARECMYSVNLKIKQFSDWLLDTIAAGDIDTYFPTSAREHASFMDEIWKDPAIQETYKKREELQVLPDVAKYFLDRVIEVSSDEYEPSEKDILLAEGVTPSNGFACNEFSFDDHSAISEICDENSVTQNDLPKYQLIQLELQRTPKQPKTAGDVRRHERHCLYFINRLSSSVNPENWYSTKQDAGKQSFSGDNCAKFLFCGHTVSILLLNKYDQFQDKIKEIPLTVREQFNDFNPSKIHSKNHSSTHQTYYNVPVKFMRWHSFITGRKLFVWTIQDLERTSNNRLGEEARRVLCLEYRFASSAELSCSSRNL